MITLGILLSKDTLQSMIFLLFNMNYIYPKGRVQNVQSNHPKVGLPPSEDVATKRIFKNRQSTYVIFNITLSPSMPCPYTVLISHKKGIYKPRHSNETKI